MQVIRRGLVAVALLLVLLFLASCGNSPTGQSLPTTFHPSCSATPLGSSEVAYADSRIGGEWGQTTVKTKDGAVLEKIAGTVANFTVDGSQLVTLIHVYLQSGLSLWCDQVTLYWAGLHEPDSRFSYAVAGVSPNDYNPMFGFSLDHFQDLNLFNKGRFLTVPCGVEVNYYFDVGAKLPNGQIIYKRAPNGLHKFKRSCSVSS